MGKAPPAAEPASGAPVYGPKLPPGFVSELDKMAAEAGQALVQKARKKEQTEKYARRILEINQDIAVGKAFLAERQASLEGRLIDTLLGRDPSAADDHIEELEVQKEWTIKQAETSGVSLEELHEAGRRLHVLYLVPFDRDSGYDLFAPVEPVEIRVGVMPGPVGRMPLRGPNALRVPQVADPKLQNLVRDLYKGAKGPNPIGTGSTADAVRNELLTGLPTQGRFHSVKAQQYINALSSWLRNNPNASHYDRLVAQSMLNDINAALGGK